jgi:hypothetical protein
MHTYMHIYIHAHVYIYPSASEGTAYWGTNARLDRSSNSIATDGAYLYWHSAVNGVCKVGTGENNVVYSKVNNAVSSSSVNCIVV